MLIFDLLAFATGLALLWTGASGRLSTIVSDPETGADRASGIGNALAILGGTSVLAATVF